MLQGFGLQKVGTVYIYPWLFLNCLFDSLVSNCVFFQLSVLTSLIYLINRQQIFR